MTSLPYNVMWKEGNRKEVLLQLEELKCQILASTIFKERKLIKVIFNACIKGHQGTRKKAYLFQNWFCTRNLKVSWVAIQAIISLENLGTEVSEVYGDIFPEGIQMTRRTVNLCMTGTSSCQGKWETEVEGSPALMCNKITQ